MTDDVAVRASKWWASNAVRSCGIRDANSGALELIKGGDGILTGEGRAGESAEALWAARRFAQHLGGGDARDSVYALRSLEAVRGHGPKRGKLWAFSAKLGHPHGDATLMLGQRWGTCWFAAMAPAGFLEQGSGQTMPQGS